MSKKVTTSTTKMFPKKVYSVNLDHGGEEPSTLWDTDARTLLEDANTDYTHNTLETEKPYTIVGIYELVGTKEMRIVPTVETK
jgi:hypothetical protein